MTASLPIAASPQLPSPAEIERSAMRSTAQSLEAHFLAEMLKAAGLHEQAGAFGGGPGEAQFASILRHAQAEQMVAAGGIGLAETIYQAILAHEGGARDGA